MLCACMLTWWHSQSQTMSPTCGGRCAKTNLASRSIAVAISSRYRGSKRCSPIGEPSVSPPPIAKHGYSLTISCSRSRKCVSHVDAGDEAFAADAAAAAAASFASRIQHSLSNRPCHRWRHAFFQSRSRRARCFMSLLTRLRVQNVLCHSRDVVQSCARW